MTFRVLRWVSLAGPGLMLVACQTTLSASPAETADTLIINGTVFDGSGGPAQQADIAISGDKIVALGSDLGSRYRASDTIDASGLIVAPGFIDPHTHAGGDLASRQAKRRANLAYIHQGVTTVVVGNDGFGKPDVAAMAKKASRRGIGTNVAYLAGFGPIREAALGKANRAPTEPELAQMQATTRQAMCEGAWGLSAGLYYVPQNYAKTDEIIALAKITSEFGGYYDTHMRDESTYNITVTGAVNEAIEIGREADLPVHIAHIKALGPAVWGHSKKMIAAIESARADGLRVTADQYPWTASGTRISNALVPRWALEGGLENLRERLADTEQLGKIRKGMIAGLERRGGAERLLITGKLGGADVPLGKTLAELAADVGRSPVDTALAILVHGDARVASFNMNADDIAAFAERDWVVTGSDGSTGHPRKYASFPKAYRDLVIEGDMSLSRFIRRSSAMTAEIIGLRNRGYLKAGYAADLVLFDPDNFAPVATYQSPRELSQGVQHLLVNGVSVIKDGKYTEALPGTPLLKRNGC